MQALQEAMPKFQFATSIVAFRVDFITNKSVKLNPRIEVLTQPCPLKSGALSNKMIL